MRLNDHTKTPAKKYKEGTTTLVGTKVRSMFSDHFFFQDLVLHHPHRSLEKLLHPNDDELPPPIRHFAAAWLYRSEMWTDMDKVRQHFSLLGNKDEYIETVIEHVKSRTDFLHLWQRKVVGSIGVFDKRDDQETNLTLEQERVLCMTRSALAERSRFYEDIPELNTAYESDVDSDEDNAANDLQTETVATTGIDWRKFVYIDGKPGTGKSFAVCKAIDYGLEKNYNVTVGTPTGFLASTYRGRFTELEFNRHYTRIVQVSSQSERQAADQLGTRADRSLGNRRTIHGTSKDFHARYRYHTTTAHTTSSTIMWRWTTTATHSNSKQQNGTHDKHYSPPKVQKRLHNRTLSDTASL